MPGGASFERQLPRSARGGSPRANELTRMKSDKRAGEARLFLRKCCVLHSVFEDIDSNEPSRVNAICASELGDSCLKTVREWVWVVGLELNPNLNNKLQTNRDQMGLGCWTKWVWVVGLN